MAIQDGLRDIGGNMLNHPDFAKVMALASGRASVTNTIYRQCESKCSVVYTENHHEIIMWNVSVMLAEYVAGLLIKKADDGHCYHHKPCPDTSEMHLNMAADFSKALGGLVAELDAEIKRLRPIVDARKPKPTITPASGS